MVSDGTPQQLKATVGGATVQITVDPRGSVPSGSARGFDSRSGEASADTDLLPATDGTDTLRHVARAAGRCAAGCGSCWVRGPSHQGHGARKIHAELTREGSRFPGAPLSGSCAPRVSRGIPREKTCKTTLGDGAETSWTPSAA